MRMLAHDQELPSDERRPPRPPTVGYTHRQLPVRLNIAARMGEPNIPTRVMQTTGCHHHPLIKKRIPAICPISCVTPCQQLPLPVANLKYQHNNRTRVYRPHLHIHHHHAA